MKIIKKYDAIQKEGRILNTQSDSQSDTYSCNYINEKITDTGWVTVPYINGYSSGSFGGILECRKINNIVYLKGGTNSSSGGSTVTIATLPEGFRPKERIDFFAASGGRTITRILIQPNGNIMIDYIGAWDSNGWYSGTAWINISHTFMVN